MKGYNILQFRNKLLFMLLIKVFYFTTLQAQSSFIIPEPNAFVQGNEWIEFTEQKIPIVFKNLEQTPILIESVKKCFSETLNIEVEVKPGTFKRGEKRIIIENNPHISNDEGYRLVINSSGIHIKAKTVAGAYYGVQTLDQYLKSFPETIYKRKIKEVKIEDAPRFPFRALMLDPARHFISVENVKRYIDAMSKYKFNTLHFHLADDHGWCLKMEDYPKLTEVGSKRDASPNDEFLISGSYSKKDLKELVRYAKARNVEIMPEIDIPGHGHTLLTAYPEFACFPDTTLTPEITEDYPHAAPICIGNENFYKFYEDIIAYLAEVFPGKKLHVGGDEVNKEAWSKCPKCQGLKEREGLKKDDELMDYLFARVNKIAEAHDKELIFWHEKGHKYPKGKTVTLWRNGTAQAVIDFAKNNNVQLICAPGEYCYLDYAPSANDKFYMPKWIPVLPLKQVYEFDPAYGLEKEDSKFIIGIEATMWGESIKDIDRLFYMTFPRAFALSEAGWTNMENRSWGAFKNKLQPHLKYLLEAGINYKPPINVNFKD